MKTEKTAHTPTPWTLRDGYIIEPRQNVGLAETFQTGVKGQGQANAAFIVQAVNAHEGLVEAAKDAYQHLIHSDPKAWTRPYVSQQACAIRLANAIAKAEGK